VRDISSVFLRKSLQVLWPKGFFTAVTSRPGLEKMLLEGLESRQISGQVQIHEGKHNLTDTVAQYIQVSDHNLGQIIDKLKYYRDSGIEAYIYDSQTVIHDLASVKKTFEDTGEHMLHISITWKMSEQSHFYTNVLKRKAPDDAISQRANKSNITSDIAHPPQTHPSSLPSAAKGKLQLDNIPEDEERSRFKFMLGSDSQTAWFKEHVAELYRTQLSRKDNATRPRPIP